MSSMKEAERLGRGTSLRSLMLNTSVDGGIKVVICARYINRNKITKSYYISLIFKSLLVFIILYSLQCKIEGHAV